MSNKTTTPAAWAAMQHDYYEDSAYHLRRAVNAMSSCIAETFGSMDSASDERVAERIREAAIHVGIVAHLNGGDGAYWPEHQTRDELPRAAFEAISFIGNYYLTLVDDIYSFDHTQAAYIDVINCLHGIALCHLNMPLEALCKGEVQ